MSDSDKLWKLTKKYDYRVAKYLIQDKKVNWKKWRNNEQV